MPAVTSNDGTVIGCDVRGTGPALIVVDGALTTRTSGSKAKLIDLLAPHLTICTYDRRGRGESGDTAPYAVEREIEDLAAVIRETGGTAALYGHSSGGCLALEASLALGGMISKLAMYEPPYDDDPAARQPWEAYLADMTAALADGRPGEAVALFMALVGTPAEQIKAMRRAPSWPSMEAVAPTLAYDHTYLLGSDRSVPVGRAAAVAVPTLVMHGAAGAPFMAESARTLQRVIPAAELRCLAGQGHDVSPEVLAPVLAEFVAA